MLFALGVGLRCMLFALSEWDRSRTRPKFAFASSSILDTVAGTTEGGRAFLGGRLIVYDSLNLTGIGADSTTTHTVLRGVGCQGEEWKR